MSPIGPATAIELYAAASLPVLGGRIVVSSADTLLDAPGSFDWQPQPLAAAFVRQLLDEFCKDCPPARQLAKVMRERTGTRLADWVDSLAIPGDESLSDRLHGLGFELTADGGPRKIWEHGHGLFPPIEQTEGGVRRVALKVDSVADFVVRHGLGGSAQIHGGPLAPLRKARIASGRGTELWIVQRHGRRGWDLAAAAPRQLQAAAGHADAFCRRKRIFEREEVGFDHARALVSAAVDDLGPDWASDLFFAAEREYWTNRNRAARFQKARQDALGLGWANHDHHTYRSSREHFARLIEILAPMGFRCRERFYAGREAGWGAQVLEQPESSIVVFADVDLAPDEVSGDFAHQALAPNHRYGTVGLWCKLHGEAFLRAGMHHLECRFEFRAAAGQLRRAGFPVMKPFTDLPYLKQAFTEGEAWLVEPARAEAALAAGAITRQQADALVRSKAIGSHLEILQRDEGYKGFNKAGISEIIRQTDPRKRL